MVAGRGSMLGQVVQKFQDAASPGDKGETPTKVQKIPFIEGLEAFVLVLDALGGGMGAYLLANTTKLRNSKAPSASGNYCEWLLSELPVHGATNYKSYVDDSAWMANLWIAWTLEFFVELFAQLNHGGGTAESARSAYKTTLSQHHNFLQRNAFNQAIKKLPERRELFMKLQGEGKADDVARDAADFVILGRPLVHYCLEMNRTVERLLKERQGAGPGKELVVSIIGAKGLKHLNLTGDAPWCQCDVKHDDGRTTFACKTVALRSTFDPEWNETHHVKDWHEGESLLFTVYSRGLACSKREGIVMMPSSSFAPMGFDGSVSLDGSEHCTLYVRIQPSIHSRSLTNLFCRARRFAANPRAQVTAVFAVGGATGAGTLGGVFGVGMGVALGTAVGLPAGLVTFGLSIPIGAAVGAAVGGGAGVTVGSTTGFLGGGAAGYCGYAYKDEIKQLATNVFKNAGDC